MYFSFQCLSDNKFAKAEDECIKNPKNCPDGFSFSLFFKPEYTETDNELVLESDKADKEYIISNGGEVGRPGFSVYRKGGNLGAIGMFNFNHKKVTINGNLFSGKLFETVRNHF